MPSVPLVIIHTDLRVFEAGILHCETVFVQPVELKGSPGILFNENRSAAIYALQGVGFEIAAGSHDDFAFQFGGQQVEDDSVGLRTPHSGTLV